MYFQYCSYEPMDLKYVQQIASYEVTKINTAYLSGVSSHFGNKLRMFLNMTLKKDERIKAVKNKMKKNSGPEEEASAIVKTIVEQCNKVKSKCLEAFKSILKTIKAFILPYVAIGTLILSTQILKNPITSHLDKEIIWVSVLNVAAKAMKPQNERKTMKLRGMLFTEGVGVSVLKQNDNMKKGGSGTGRRTKAVDEEDFKYVEKLEKEVLLAGIGKCVLTDPGRRDMLYCMHEESTIENRRTYRYTSNQRIIETKTRKFKKLRENLKPDNVRAVEVSLSNCKSSTVNVGKFAKYLQKRATVTPVLSKYYANEDIPAVDANLLPFRKMKPPSFINGQQADKRLTRNLITKLGDDATLIIGNWSTGNVKFHEPIRGTGMRRMLAKQGFKICLLDECKISSLFPSCLSGKLEKFKKVQNSRPFQREKQPTVTCHGTLRCKNQQCLEDTTGTISRRRLWNRDMVATLNFRHILFGLRENGKRPERFCRHNAPPSTSFKRKAISSAISRPTKKTTNPL
ncbi:uncharacterized protein RHIMIDRAFT_299849 [Rhizopus microsporus ATCC 52813]|uniref:Uncharacterized protein n=1 Tax=Rhizopus microsporus ATCC 52813 TaxID=1340429 RepID=A0A2G4SKY2_RHIZD|nr:uncharacterized protein RHIMIDRAFT_299849 [Rhizopus microsporus ATCC 52813]PHZ09425.1 hypothetical protein RHIMIDRAFT_299849 [Rhizopus microsporus ATCC 52813]